MFPASRAILRRCGDPADGPATHLQVRPCPGGPSRGRSGNWRMTARDRSCIAKSPGRAHTGALAEASPVPPSDWGVERMDPGIDAQAGDVPWEPPSRVFDMVLRGYDRHQVDEQIERLENRVRQHRD